MDDQPFSDSDDQLFSDDLPEEEEDHAFNDDLPECYESDYYSSQQLTPLQEKIIGPMRPIIESYGKSFLTQDPDEPKFRGADVRSWLVRYCYQLVSPFFAVLSLH